MADMDKVLSVTWYCTVHDILAANTRLAAGGPLAADDLLDRLLVSQPASERRSNMVLSIVVLDYDTRLVEVELAINGWEERLDDLLRDCGHATRHGFDHFAFNESEQEPTILSSCSKPVWELKEAPVYRFETPAKIRPQHVPRCDCIAVECELALLASQVMHQELGRGLRSGTHVPQHGERTYELDIECVRPDWERLCTLALVLAAEAPMAASATAATAAATEAVAAATELAPPVRITYNSSRSSEMCEAQCVWRIGNQVAHPTFELVHCS